jgi:hypothetical protein
MELCGIAILVPVLFKFVQRTLAMCCHANQHLICGVEKQLEPNNLFVRGSDFE